MPKRINGAQVPLAERLKRIHTLFKRNSPLDEYLVNEFLEIISKVALDVLSKQEQTTFYRITNSVWKVIGESGQYLAMGQKSDDWLRKRYYDPDRKTNQINMTSLKMESRLDPAKDGLEYAESVAYHHDYLRQLPAEITPYPILLYNLKDPVQFEIAKLLYLGYTRKEICEHLQLTYNQIRTQIDKIRKNILIESVPNLVQASKKSKICTKCRQEKSYINFGKDKRNKDGLQSICRTCDKKRKNFNSLQEYPQKTA